MVRTCTREKLPHVLIAGAEKRRKWNVEKLKSNENVKVFEESMVRGLPPYLCVVSVDKNIDKDWEA